MTMIRWPLGFPPSFVIELPSDELLYVLVVNDSQQTQVYTSFNNWSINLDNIVFIKTSNYTHWTRYYGPKFLISDENCQIINQQFNGFLDESGFPEDCDNNMIFVNCEGNEFCNNQPDYSELGHFYI